MRAKFDYSKFYLLLAYLSLAALWLLMLPESHSYTTLAAYTLALVLIMVLAYEPFLSQIRKIVGFAGEGDELKYFSAFVDLNKKIHKLLRADEVLLLVDDTLKDRVKARKTVFLLHEELYRQFREESENPDTGASGAELTAWPDSHRRYDFLGDEFVDEVLRWHDIFSLDDGTLILKNALHDTGTDVGIPIMQGNNLLCLIMLSRGGSRKPFSEFEHLMFGYLANQLSIVLDRIRIYEQIMQKTAEDHAEKLQVMQSLSANIAHEMRTPLSGIRASISGIEAYLPDLIEAYDVAKEVNCEKVPLIRENHLQTLRSTPERITLMIDQANAVIDMLLMNLRDNSFDGKQLHACSAAECVSQAVDRYPFKTGERSKVHLDLEQDFRFMGVQTLFIYIVFNLLKNALYSIRSAQKGEIQVWLVRGEKYNHIYFRDTGEGVPREVRDKIFEGFFTTKSDGTGAGLTFCKRTLVSFGGDITCDSVPGEYAEFKITLPNP